jgi:penicillin-insensitive murein endopeptidase
MNWKGWAAMRDTCAALLWLSLLPATAVAAPAPSAESTSKSQCFGTTSKGRIANAVALPPDGPNFRAYSAWGISAGRTYVHGTVRQIMLDAYAAVHRRNPTTRFIYGETGLREGGRFEPHRTHQNGLSVDFMVPVVDAKGQPAELPTHLQNRFGYDLDFDSEGRLDGLQIDFAAVADHLAALQAAAKAHGADIGLVIFHPGYLPRLFATPAGTALKTHMPFMKKEAWVRHDDHYHVDFKVRCAPL